MKKYLAVLAGLIFALSLYSCGGGGGGKATSLSGFSPQSSYNPLVDKAYLAYDLTYSTTNPDKLIIPFPNDIVTEASTRSLSTRSITLPTGGIEDPAEKALFTAINKLNLQGFSPLTPITIPLGGDLKLDPDQLQANIKAIDINAFVGLTLKNYLAGYLTTNPSDPICNAFNANPDNQTLAFGCFANLMNYYYEDNLTKFISIIQSVKPYIFAKLQVKQNGNVINAYPLRPFNPGDRYVAVVLNGIGKLQPSPIFEKLIGNDNLTGQFAPLEPLREGYVKLLPLLKMLGIDKDNLLEMFTFTVADKTLGLEDYALIQKAALTGNLTYLDNISGYNYSDLDNLTYAGTNSQNEYLQIDTLSDLPILCQGLYDNATLRVAFDLPKITDNLSTFMLTPNVYALSDIEGIMVKYNFPDNSTSYPYVCKAIFDNATLYDNVTLTSRYTTSNPANIKEFVIFQHGLGRSKEDIDLIKSAFPDSVIYAMDLPWHGNRIPPNPMLASQCTSTESGACYLTKNVIADVLNIYQSLLDMHTFTKFVYAGDAKLMASYSLPPLPIYFIGQSMGSITGSMLMNIDNITSSSVLPTEGLPANNYISKAVLNVGGANYSAILNEATNPMIEHLLCSALNITPCTQDEIAKYRDTVGYNMTLAIFQLILDPVDPEFMAYNPSIKNKILIQSAYHDTLVPNISNEILYNDYLTSPVYSPENISCDNESISTSETQPGWYMFIGEEPYSWINHGFFVHTADTLDELNTMYPSAAGHMALMCVNNAETLARQQACGFFIGLDNCNP